MPLITHTPAGVEHPYARSLDQLWPAQPMSGEALGVGVVERTPLARVDFVVDAGGAVTRVPMAKVAAHETDAASFAGGDGHLDEAQEALHGADGGWECVLENVPAGTSRYWFEALSVDGRSERSEEFLLVAAAWTREPIGAVTGADDRLVPGSIEWLVSDAGVHRARFALALAAGDHVVGFGERFDQLDQRGRRLDAVVFEQYKSQYAHHRTYLPMPFAHVIGADGTGWGFHVRTSRRTWFDVAASAPDRLVIEVDLGLPEDAVAAVDLGVWPGTPAEVLDAFLTEAGRAEELPEWVFGLWASGNEWNTQRVVLEQADRHRDEHIPISAIVIEAWSDEEGFTIFRDAAYAPNAGEPHVAADFSYPAEGAWPDPAGMIADLHERGVRVVLWQIPLQRTDGVLHEQALAQQQALLDSGRVVREVSGEAYRNRGWWFPQALMPDLTTAEGREWWTSQRRYLVDELDVDGFKTDGGEHAWGRDLRYGDGTRGAESNNRFPVEYARAFGDLLRSAGKAPVTFSRAGFTGSQATGAYWAGDENSTWEGFRASITAGLTASACGIVYWGWDIAGFSGPVPEAELYARAFGASAFVPIMQYHSEFNHHRLPLRDRTPWNVAEQTGHPELVELARVFTGVREELRPYLAEQARVSIETARPLMRALFFDHPDDPEIWAHPLQFGLGDHLLVNPITEPGATTWTTYLPAGRWRDFWTGEVLDGGRTVSRPYPWSQVPVFWREASLRRRRDIV